jgi:threonine dehydrogenase-like Zn-dependent dehydrogenase
MVAPTRNLTVVPKSIPFAEVALVESAGTANRAIRLLDVGPGTYVLVIGVGGLGMQAVRLALAKGAKVVTVDKDPLARDRSLEAGAVASFAPGGDLGAKLDGATNGAGFYGAVDCVGAPTTISVALETLKQGGGCAIVGIGSVAAILTPPAHFVRRGLRIFGVYGYSDFDIAQVIERVGDGSLDLAPSVSHLVGLADVNEGIRRFASRENSPTRVVVEIA